MSLSSLLLQPFGGGMGWKSSIDRVLAPNSKRRFLKVYKCNQKHSGNFLNFLREFLDFLLESFQFWWRIVLESGKETIVRGETVELRKKRSSEKRKIEKRTLMYINKKKLLTLIVTISTIYIINKK